MLIEERWQDDQRCSHCQCVTLHDFYRGGRRDLLSSNSRATCTVCGWYFRYYSLDGQYFPPEDRTKEDDVVNSIEMPEPNEIVVLEDTPENVEAARRRNEAGGLDIVIIDPLDLDMSDLISLPECDGLNPGVEIPEMKFTDPLDLDMPACDGIHPDFLPGGKFAHLNQNTPEGTGMRRGVCNVAVGRPLETPPPYSQLGKEIREAGMRLIKVDEEPIRTRPILGDKRDPIMWEETTEQPDGCHVPHDVPKDGVKQVGKTLKLYAHPANEFAHATRDLFVENPKPEGSPPEDLKYFYLGSRVCYVCPKCEKQSTHNLDENPLHYVQYNVPFHFICYCVHCGHDWESKTKLRLNVELETCDA